MLEEQKLDGVKYEDYTNRFNTELNKGQVKEFRKFFSKVGKIYGENMFKRLKNYDLQGWWLNNVGPNGNTWDEMTLENMDFNTLPQKYTKPNHPEYDMIYSIWEP